MNEQNIYEEKFSKRLVPNVRRDDNNHRIFDEYDVEWIKGTQCLRACGLCLEFEVPVTMNIFGDCHFFLFCSALSITSQSPHQ